MKVRSLLLMLSGLILFSCGGKGPASSFKLPDDSEKVKNGHGLWLVESEICRAVQNREPVDPGSEFASDTPVRVYFFTKFGCEEPGHDVYHRYSRLMTGIDGKKTYWVQTHISDLRVESVEYRTWTYTMAGPGTWRVDALGPDGISVIKAHVFEVKPVKEPEPAVFTDKDYNASGLDLEDIFICEAVQNKEPVNPTNVLFVPPGRAARAVWCWMRFLAEEAPTRATLRWSRNITDVDGKTGLVPETYIKVDVGGKKWRTYAYRNCFPGEYRLDVLAPDGKRVVRSLDFEVRETPSLSMDDEGLPGPEEVPEENTE